MEWLTEAFNTNFKPWWNSKDSASKVLFASVGVAALVAFIVSATFLIRPSFETLYVGLDTQEAGQVVEKLKEYKVTYKLDNGGTSIMVPRKNIYDVRLRLASEGLPKSGSLGYEILDETKLGMTEFLQKINYRRAIEGELAKSISGLRGVRSARVHIVIPEARLFREDKKEATASIVLSLSKAGGISESQVEGILYLVSSSVEGLSPDNVTILDSAGRLLSSRKHGSELGALSSSQLDLKKHVEGYLEGKALSILDPIIGPGKSVVKISAKLNFEQVEQTIENYDSDNPAVRSEEKITESTSEENTGETGKGTVASNSIENVVTNYEINRTVQHIVNEVGNVDRLWVSIVVDGVIKKTEGADGISEEYVPRAPEELDRLANLIKSAIGFDMERNDVLEIANVEFLRENYDYSESYFTRENFEDLIEIGYKILLFLIALIVLSKIRKAVKSYIKTKKVEAKRKAAAAEAEKKRRELLPKINNEPKLVDHMREIAKDQPNEVAKVIKTMLSQD